MSADYFDASFAILKGEVMKVVTPLQAAAGAPPEGQPPPKRPQHAARKVQEVAGAVTAALGLPLQLLNDGFAIATAGISAMLPPFPAAFLGSLYVGPPHGHTHPPSMIPPAPPVPLPSLGNILLGTSVKVLINGLPAARCGDVGLAITCCGIVPAFEVKTGSSKVFIGGARAARAIDFCIECDPGGGSMNALAIASLVFGTIGTAAGAVADAQEAADAIADNDEALAAAKALSAQMAIAQLAVEAATMAIKAAMGKDPAVPPAQGMITLGSPNVFIGGFPMVNIPDPMQKLFEKLKARLSKPKRGNAGEGEEGCTTCPK